MFIHEDAVKLRQNFDKLQTVLINLRSLPLAIVGVKCISGYYRRTKSFPSNGILVSYKKNDNVSDEVALLNNNGYFPPFLPSIKVLITLERSGKWGEDLNVINKLKSAFYVDISRRLKISEKWFSVPTESQLYLFIDKILFSIFIVHQKEIELLVIQESTSKKLETQLRWKKYSSLFLRKKLIHKPLISQLLFGLIQRHPIFTETCIYVRKWLSWNFLSKMLEGMAIELLVAHLFVNTTSLPKTGLAGFARFISFLATHNFIANPVIVDINNSFLPDAIENAKEQFLKHRPVLPPLVIITPEDITGTIFTSLKPEPVVFLRIIKLASITHERICASALTNKIYSEFELPEHDLSIYDFVINLNLKYVIFFNDEKPQQNKMKKKFEPRSLYLPIVDVNPIKDFVKTLQDNYDSIALFFYNIYNNLKIGVLLRPSFMLERDSKVITGCHSRLKNENVLVANLKALVEDFKLIGADLVNDVILSDKYKNNI